jgi:ISXO2-like transposase domain
LPRYIRRRVGKGTVVHADESSAWNPLHGRFVLKRINHQEAYSLHGACVNDAESFFARMRRAEIGHHHHIACPYLIRFAQEMAWREDHRLDSNGAQVDRVVALVMRNKPSVDFCAIGSANGDYSSSFSSNGGQFPAAVIGNHLTLMTAGGKYTSPDTYLSGMWVYCSFTSLPKPAVTSRSSGFFIILISGFRVGVKKPLYKMIVFTQDGTILINNNCSLL